MQLVSNLKQHSTTLVLSAAALTLIVGGSVNPASAQTTTTTSPATVLDPMNQGAQDIDDIAGLAAAVGISSCVFGAGALIFKRFIYS